jgi:hypothetical protein
MEERTLVITFLMGLLALAGAGIGAYFLALAALRAYANGGDGFDVGMPAATSFMLVMIVLVVLAFITGEWTVVTE